MFKESSGLMFWGAIAYNWKGPCVVIRPETEAVRKQSIKTLEDHARPKWEDAMGKYWVKWMNYHMAKGWNEGVKRKDRVKTGKLPAIPKLSDFGPDRSKKGGIGGHRYHVDVLPYLLDDFERFQRFA